jgi:hypothetical protein
MTKHQCIFVHIPKAAGTSVLQALSGHKDFIRRDHCLLADFKNAESSLYKKYFSFSFVREPIDRAFSTYRYLLNGGNGTTDIKIADEISKLSNNFSDYIIHYLSVERIYSNKLLMPQFCFICDSFDNINVDYLGRFESIDEDFAIISNKLQLKTVLPESNISKKGVLEVSSEARKKIQSLYKKDFEIFYPAALTNK